MSLFLCCFSSRRRHTRSQKGDDDVSDQSSASACVRVTTCASLAGAAPDAITARALAKPAGTESTTLAAYSATPAFRHTMSCAAPGSPLSTPISISRDCSGVSTLSARLLAIGRPKSSGWISYSVIWPFFNSPTKVAAPKLTSSMPSRPYTTSACSAPRRCSARTWMPTRSGWNTPIRMLGALAGLVSGPRMLKRVRTPSSLRTGPTFFIAGWWLGANMKPMPVSAIERAIAAGLSVIGTPSASSTSALPDLLDTLRLPCLLTRAPAAAATNIEQVEMLKVCEPSPPVPTMSTRWRRSATSTLVENSRITCAAAVISPMVSFLTRRPISIADIITGDISPLMMRRITASISSWKISRWSMTRVSASWSVIGMVVLALQEAAQHAHGLVDLVGVHVEVGHQPQPVQAGEQHALLGRAPHQRRAVEAGGQVDEDNIRVGRHHPQARQRSQSVGQQAGIGMVVGQAMNVMVQRMQRSGRQHTRLAQPAAQHLAVAVGAGNQLSRADQRRAHRCAQALAEADRHAVVQAGDGARLGDGITPRRIPGHTRHRGIEQPRAVQVRGQPMLARQVGGLLLVGQRQHLATDGVFQRQQPGAGEVRIVGLDRGGDGGDRKRAVGLRSEEHTSELQSQSNL